MTNTDRRSSDTAVLVELTADLDDDVLRSGRLDAVRQARQFCDTIIETGDAAERRPLEAHACLLAAASPVLRRLLLKYRGRPMRISRKDVDLSASIWNTVLQVIYTSRAFVSISRLPALCHASCVLCMRPLEAVCGNLLRNVETQRAAEKSALASSDVDNNKQKRVFVMVNGETNGWIIPRRSPLKSPYNVRKADDETVITQSEEIDIKKEKMTADESSVGVGDEIPSSVVKVEPDDRPLVTLTDICGVNGADKAMRRKCMHPKKSAPPASPPTTVPPIVIQPKSDLFAPQQVIGSVGVGDEIPSSVVKVEPDDRPLVALTDICGVNGTDKAMRRKCMHPKKSAPPGSPLATVPPIVIQPESDLFAPQQVIGVARPRTCLTCGRTFRSGTNLARHRRTHTGEKRYRCQVCGRAFSQSQSLKYHQERVHGISLLGDGGAGDGIMKHKPEVSCGVCGMVFHEVRLLVAHTCDGDQAVLSFVKPEPADGDDDEETQQLEDKVENEIPDKISVKMEAELDNIDEMEPMLDDIELGTMTKSLQETLEGEVPSCVPRGFDESRPPRTVFLVPDELAPSGGKLYRCALCSRDFHGNKNIRRHEKTHAISALTPKTTPTTAAKNPVDGSPLADSTADPVGSVECETCGKQFATPQLQRRHWLRQHRHNGVVDQLPAITPSPVDMPYECDSCGKRFATPRLRRRHELRMHSAMVTSPAERKTLMNNGSAGGIAGTNRAARPCHCRICGKEFANNSNIRRHERTHAREMLALGEIFDGSSGDDNASSRRALRLPERVGDFVCAQCGARFARSDLLRRHARRMKHDAITPIANNSDGPIAEENNLGDAGLENDSQDIADDSCGETEDHNDGQDDITASHNGDRSVDEHFSILDGEFDPENSMNQNSEEDEDDEDMEDIVLGNTVHDYDTSLRIMDESF